jgi:hypothetical protein
VFFIGACVLVMFFKKFLTYEMFPELKVQKFPAKINFQLNYSSPMKSTCPCSKKTRSHSNDFW